MYRSRLLEKSVKNFLMLKGKAVRVLLITHWEFDWNKEKCIPFLDFAYLGLIIAHWFLYFIATDECVSAMLLIHWRRKIGNFYVRFEKDSRMSRVTDGNIVKLWCPLSIENSVWAHSNLLWKGRQRFQHFLGSSVYKL